MTDLSSQAANFTEAIKDPLPTIAEPEDTTVQLLRGLLDSSTGEWQTIATVREMTGEDEERIAAVSTEKDAYNTYMSTILSNTVVSIGTLDTQANKKLIDELLLGDRDLLFLGALRATYGQERTLVAVCSNCHRDNDVTINLVDDFPVPTTGHNPQELVSITGRKGKTYRFRIPTVADAKYISSNSTTSAENNTAMLARCAVFDTDTPPNRLDWARKINLADRTKIVNAITKAQVGPRMEEVKAPCAHCETEMILMVDWASLLFG
jgi:hypothetical protein